MKEKFEKKYLNKERLLMMIEGYFLFVRSSRNFEDLNLDADS